MVQIVLGVLLLSVVTVAESLAAEESGHPPVDHVAAVHVAVVVGTEVKRMCVERFPEIAPLVEEKFNAWPLSKVKIQILVNGKEYVSPFVESVLNEVRQEFDREDSVRRKAGCEEIDKILESFTRGAPPGALEPFIAGTRQPG
ncbi:MAG TPA: hypothetical protein VIB79_14350 [Candidatus Binatia bacterium]